jgi:hypothetical protein
VIRVFTAEIAEDAVKKENGRRRIEDERAVATDFLPSSILYLRSSPFLCVLRALCGVALERSAV